MSQSNHNFVLKSGLEAGGQLIVNAQGELVAPISGNTLPDVGTAGTYGDSAKRVSVTLDAKGRVSAVTELPIPVLSVNDTGGDGALSYNASTGVLTYTGPSASEVRASLSAVDNGGDGSLTYDAATGAFTFTGPSAAEVRAHLSAGGDLAYDSATGVFSFTERTDAEVRGLISLTDGGGDGSASYDAATGVITVTGPSASEVRAHLSAGGDLSYDSVTGVVSFTERTDAEVRGLMSAGTGISYDAATGVISAGQALGSGDDVEFNNLVLAGDLTVNGTTTTVNSTTVTINDPLLHLADSNDASDVLDMGFVSHYSDGIDQMHTGLFRDATTQKYHLFQGLTQDLESTNVVDIADPTFSAAALVAGAIEVSSVTSAGAISGTTLTGIYQGFDSDLTASSTSDLSEGTNKYYTLARVDSDIDAAFVAKSTTDLSEGDNLYYTTARADSDAKNAVSGTGSISYDPATGIISATAGAGIAAGHGLDFTAGVMSVDSSADIFINKVVAGTVDPGYGSVGFETDAGNIYSKSGEIYAYNGSITSYYGDVGTHAGNLYTAIGNITLGTSAAAGYNYSRIISYNKTVSDNGFDFGLGLGMVSLLASDSAGSSVFVGPYAGGSTASTLTEPKDKQSVAIGWNASGHSAGASGYAANTYTVSIGYQAGYRYTPAQQSHNTCVGGWSSSESSFCTSLGYGATIYGSSDYAIASGYWNGVTGRYAIAIGTFSNVQGDYSTLVGGSARVSASHGVAIGYDARTVGQYGTAIGASAYAEYKSVAVGAKAKVEEDFKYGTAVGYYAWVEGDYTISVGHMAYSYAPKQVTIGSKTNNPSAAAGSVLIGYNSTTAFEYSTVVGFKADADGQYSTLFGAYTQDLSDKSVMVGAKAKSLNSSSSGSIGIGYSATSAGSYGVAIGGYATVQGAQGIAIGYYADAFAKDVVMRTDGVDRIRFKDSDDSFNLSATSLVMAGTATKTGSVSTSSVTPTVLDTFAAADFRSAKFTVQTTNTTDSKYQSTEILLIHDGTNTHVTEFGTLYTGDSAEADFSAAIVSGNVELSVTAATADAMVHKVVRHAVDA